MRFDLHAEFSLFEGASHIGRKVAPFEERFDPLLLKIATDLFCELTLGSHVGFEEEVELRHLLAARHLARQILRALHALPEPLVGFRTAHASSDLLALLGRNVIEVRVGHGR
jgi:hypothetical protein